MYTGLLYPLVSGETLETRGCVRNSIHRFLEYEHKYYCWKQINKIILYLLALIVLFGYSIKANADNRLRVGGIISAGFIFPGLQDLLPKDKEGDKNGGSAIMFDIFIGEYSEHSVVLESHALSEVIPDLGIEFRTDVSYVGYRFHPGIGFYVGGGTILLHNIETDTPGVVFSAEIPILLGLNLGYVYTFDSGFSIGVNGLYSNSVKLNINDSFSNSVFIDNGYAVRTLGLVLAYTHRD